MDNLNTKSTGAEYSIPIPALSDSEIAYYSPECDVLEPVAGDEIVAVACGTYLGPDVGAYNTHRQLIRQMTADYGHNLWNIPSQARLPYPYTVLVMLSSLMKTEQKFGRKADWFLWLDDDVLVPPNLMRVLREAADPEDRPFVAAVGYDRKPPFGPAVWDSAKAGDVDILTQWTFDRVPESGVHEVAVTGLCAALFHRSIFDRVPQPWFAFLPKEINDAGGLHGGANPDSWWSQQCRLAGVPIYVTCDVDITHLGDKMPVNRESAPVLAEIFSGR